MNINHSNIGARATIAQDSRIGKQFHPYATRISPLREKKRRLNLRLDAYYASLCNAESAARYRF